MKILQVSPRYLPHVGGVETHVQELSEGLVERSHDVTVLTADAGHEAKKETEINGVTVKRCQGFSPQGAFHIAPGIIWEVKQSNPDIIHAHNYHGLPLFFAAASIGDAKFVTTPHYHGASASSVRDRLLTLYKPLGAWALRQSDAVIAVSDWEADRLHEDFGIDAEVIPNGLRVDRFRNAKPEERNRPYLLTVGRLEEYKGVQHAIRALDHLPDYNLVVAGDGPYREELEEIASEDGLADRVSFEGYVSDERLPSLYAGAEVYLTLSEFEAYGMTVGEALAAGTPCVVREAGALVDWTTRSDCVGVPVPRPSQVSEAVRNAVNRAAPEEPLPDWKQVVDSVESVYERIHE